MSQALKHILVGAVAAALLLLACESARDGGAGGDAGAAEATCSVWQVARLDALPLPDGVAGAADLPAGWEPVTVYGGGTPSTASVYLKRCKP